VVGSCVSLRLNEISGSIKDGEFLSTFVTVSLERFFSMKLTVKPIPYDYAARNTSI
jgi:hypothetical protein